MWHLMHAFQLTLTCAQNSFAICDLSQMNQLFGTCTMTGMQLYAFHLGDPLSGSIPSQDEASMGTFNDGENIYPTSLATPWCVSSGLLVNRSPR